METSLILRNLSKSPNKLLTGLFSLFENIKAHGFVSVDIADLINVTDKSNSMHLILEKQFFEKELILKQKINIEETPKNIKSIWIDIWISSVFIENRFDIFEKIIHDVKELFPDNLEVILTDAYDMVNLQNTISIIAFD